MPENKKVNEREPIVPNLPLISGDSESAIMRKFRRIFDEYFAEDLFDTSGNLCYQHLYTEGREPASLPSTGQNAPPRSASDIDVDEPTAEGKLYRVFWEIEKYPHPLMLLVGDVGSGKSTALKMFFTRVCPQRRAKEDDRLAQRDFAHKCVVYLDLCHQPSRNLYRDVCIAIRAAMLAFLGNFENPHLLRPAGQELSEHPNINILSDDDFLFLRPMQDFRVFEGWSEEEKLKHAAGLTEKLTAEEWVDLALSYLAAKRQRNDSAFPLKYLVLILDNGDQSGYECVKTCIDFITRWARRGGPFWRMIVPLWPVMFSRLYRDMDPRPLLHDIHIQMVDTLELIKLRASALREYIVKGGEGLDMGTNPGGKGDLKWSPEDLCRFLSETLETAVTGDKLFQNCMRRLAGNSTRRLLGLLREILSSDTLPHHHVQRQDGGRIGGDVRVYGCFDALLTGGVGFHHRDRSPVMNVFFLNSRVADCYDSLIGWHLLQILGGPEILNDWEILSGRKPLKHPTELSVGSVTDRLRSLGYFPATIEEALAALARKQVIQWSSSRKVEFLFQPDLVAGHIILVDVAAYIENIAMTTPVKDQFASKMRRTVSYESSQFFTRMRTTIAFLEQIKSDEEALRRGRAIGAGRQKALATALTEEQLLSAFVIMAKQIRTRIVTLERLQEDNRRRNQRGERIPMILSGMKPHDWQALKEEKIFRDLGQYPTWLSPISANGTASAG